MSLHVLWPMIRWPDNLQIETDALGPGVTPHFSHSVKDVTDEVGAGRWHRRRLDLPDETIAKMKRADPRPPGGRLRQHRHHPLGAATEFQSATRPTTAPWRSRPRHGADADADESIAFHDERLRKDPSSWMPR
jgi:hypothetical protein